MWHQSAYLTSFIFVSDFVFCIYFFHCLPCLFFFCPTSSCVHLSEIGSTIYVLTVSSQADSNLHIHFIRLHAQYKLHVQWKCTSSQCSFIRLIRNFIAYLYEYLDSSFLTRYQSELFFFLSLYAAHQPKGLCLQNASASPCGQ